MVDNMKHRLGALTVALLVACSPAVKPTPDPVSDDPVTVSDDPSGDVPSPGQTARLVDEEGNLICEIDSRSTCMAADEGIFYSIFAPGENEATATALYRFFRMEDKTEVSKRSFEGQGYEPSFVRTELGGVMYTLAITGSPMDNNPDDLFLLAFFPSTNKIGKVRVSATGFPYAAMAAVNGNLLIMNHEMTDPRCDKIYEYDPERYVVNEAMSFPAGKETDSIRSVADGEDGFYLLRVHVDASDNTELFIDKYSYGYDKQSSLSLNSLITEAGKKAGLLAEDAAAEHKHHVSGFRVVGGRYMFYENFSCTRAIIDLESKKVLFAGNDMCQLSTGSGRPLFYSLQFSSSDKSVIVGLKDGAIEEIPFTPKDSGSLFQGLSISPSGNWLVRLFTPSGATQYVWIARGE